MSRLRKDLIQQRFRRQLYNYRRHAVVQESMAEHLAALTSRLCSSQKWSVCLKLAPVQRA